MASCCMRAATPPDCGEPTRGNELDKLSLQKVASEGESEREGGVRTAKATATFCCGFHWEIEFAALVAPSNKNNNSSNGNNYNRARQSDQSERTKQTWPQYNHSVAGTIDRATRRGGSLS